MSCDTTLLKKYLQEAGVDVRTGAGPTRAYREGAHSVLDLADEFREDCSFPFEIAADER